MFAINTIPSTPEAFSSPAEQITHLQTQLASAKSSFDTLLASHERQTEHRISLINRRNNEKLEDVTHRLRTMRDGATFQAKTIREKEKEWLKDSKLFESNISYLQGEFKRQIKEQEGRMTEMARENRAFRAEAVEKWPEVYNECLEDENELLEKEKSTLEGKVVELDGVVKVLHENILKGGEEISYHIKRHAKNRSVISELRRKNTSLLQEKDRKIMQLTGKLRDGKQILQFRKDIEEADAFSTITQKVEDMLLAKETHLNAAHSQINLLQDKLREKDEALEAKREELMKVENELDTTLFFEQNALLHQPEYQSQIESLHRWAELRDEENNRLKALLQQKEQGQEEEDTCSAEKSANLDLNEQLTTAHSQTITLQEENLALKEHISSLEWKLAQYTGENELKTSADESWRTRTNTPVENSTEGLDEQTVRVARQKRVRGVEDCDLFPGVGKPGEPVVSEAFNALRKIYPECYKSAGKFGELRMAVPMARGLTVREVRMEREDEEADEMLEWGVWPEQMPRVKKVVKKVEKVAEQAVDAGWGTDWAEEWPETQGEEEEGKDHSAQAQSGDASSLWGGNESYDDEHPSDSVVDPYEPESDPVFENEPGDQDDFASTNPSEVIQAPENEVELASYGEADDYTGLGQDVYDGLPACLRGKFHSVNGMARDSGL